MMIIVVVDDAKSLDVRSIFTHTNPVFGGIWRNVFIFSALSCDKNLKLFNYDILAQRTAYCPIIETLFSLSLTLKKDHFMNMLYFLQHLLILLL